MAFRRPLPAVALSGIPAVTGPNQFTVAPLDVVSYGGLQVAVNTNCLAGPLNILLPAPPGGGAYALHLAANWSGNGVTWLYDGASQKAIVNGNTPLHGLLFAGAVGTFTNGTTSYAMTISYDTVLVPVIF